MAKRLTNEVVDDRLGMRPIIRLDSYINSQTKINWECIDCGNIWLAVPNHILQGKGCPNCAIVGKAKEATKTHKQYLKEIKNIKVLDVYVDDSTKIKHQCNICDTVWLAKPSNILQGKGCPNCANVTRAVQFSKGSIDKTLKLKAIKIPCSFYIVEGEECIKVGLSTSLINRVKELNYKGFKCNLVYKLETNLLNAYKLEQYILEKYTQYYSDIKFGGYTELKYKEDLKSIIQYIKN